LKLEGQVEYMGKRWNWVMVIDALRLQAWALEMVKAGTRRATAMHEIFTMTIGEKP